MLTSHYVQLMGCYIPPASHYNYNDVQRIGLRFCLRTNGSRSGALSLDHSRIKVHRSRSKSATVHVRSRKILHCLKRIIFHTKMWNSFLIRLVYLQWRRNLGTVGTYLLLHIGRYLHYHVCAYKVQKIHTVLYISSLLREERCILKFGADRSMKNRKSTLFKEKTLSAEATPLQMKIYDVGS